MNRAHLFVVGAIALVLATLAVTQTDHVLAHGPKGHTNLQVLPKDIGHKKLDAVMKAQARSLGVKCTHCHVKGDYASDKKKSKLAARQMMRMVRLINKSHISWPKAQAVTCWTCHRGKTKPPKRPKGQR